MWCIILSFWKIYFMFLSPNRIKSYQNRSSSSSSSRGYGNKWNESHARASSGRKKKFHEISFYLLASIKRVALKTPFHLAPNTKLYTLHTFTKRKRCGEAREKICASVAEIFSFAARFSSFFCCCEKWTKSEQRRMEWKKINDDNKERRIKKKQIDWAQVTLNMYYIL